MSVADAEIQHLVEATWSQQRLVQEIRPVRRANDKDATAVLVPVAHAVQLRQQLRDDTVHDASAVALVSTLRSHGVQLVKKDRAWPGIARPLEHPSDVRLTLTDVHVEQLGSFHREKVQTELRSDRLSTLR